MELTTIIGLFILFLFVCAVLIVTYLFILGVQEKKADIEYKQMLARKDLSDEDRSQLVQEKFYYDNTKGDSKNG